MQVQGMDSMVPLSSTYSSPLNCATKTVKGEGVKGIFRSGFATLLRDSLGNPVFCTVYEYTRYHMHSQLKFASSDHSNLVDVGVAIIRGGLGGIVFWLVVLPLDVAKTIIQTSPDKNLS